MGDDYKSSGNHACSCPLLCCCRTGNNQEDLPEDRPLLPLIKYEIFMVLKTMMTTKTWLNSYEEQQLKKLNDEKLKAGFRWKEKQPKNFADVSSTCLGDSREGQTSNQPPSKPQHQLTRLIILIPTKARSTSYRRQPKTTSLNAIQD